MLLLELKTEHTRESYVKKLVDELNIEHLGAGFAADVFAHPTHKDVAVKVVDSGDENYVAYAKWCLKQKDNPWVPKIIGIEDVDGKDGSFMIIFMEKLKPISMKAYKTFVSDVFGTDDLTDDDVAGVAKSTDDVDLKKVLKFLTKFVNALDLHDGNFMLRRKQVVFTDPLAAGD